MASKREIAAGRHDQHVPRRDAVDTSEARAVSIVPLVENEIGDAVFVGRGGDTRVREETVDLGRE